MLRTFQDVLHARTKRSHVFVDHGSEHTKPSGSLALKFGTHDSLIDAHCCKRFNIFLTKCRLTSRHGNGVLKLELVFQLVGGDVFTNVLAAPTHSRRSLDVVFELFVLSKRDGLFASEKVFVHYAMRYGNAQHLDCFAVFINHGNGPCCRHLSNLVIRTGAYDWLNKGVQKETTLLALVAAA